MEALPRDETWALTSSRTRVTGMVGLPAKLPVHQTLGPISTVPEFTPVEARAQCCQTVPPWQASLPGPQGKEAPVKGTTGVPLLSYEASCLKDFTGRTPRRTGDAPENTNNLLLPLPCVLAITET